MPSHHDVVEHAQVREQFNVLERAAKPKPCHRAGVEARNILTAEENATFTPVDAVDAIEGAGFAGAVRPDQCEELRRANLEREALQHGETAKAQAQIFNFELSHTTSGCGGTASPPDSCGARPRWRGPGRIPGYRHGSSTWPHRRRARCGRSPGRRRSRPPPAPPPRSARPAPQ